MLPALCDAGLPAVLAEAAVLLDTAGLAVVMAHAQGVVLFLGGILVSSTSALSRGGVKLGNLRGIPGVTTS